MLKFLETQGLHGTTSTLRGVIWWLPNMPHTQTNNLPSLSKALHDSNLPLPERRTIGYSLGTYSNIAAKVMSPCKKYSASNYTHSSSPSSLHDSNYKDKIFEGWFIFTEIKSLFGLKKFNFYWSYATVVYLDYVSCSNSKFLSQKLNLNGERFYSITDLLTVYSTKHGRGD